MKPIIHLLALCVCIALRRYRGNRELLQVTFKQRGINWNIALVVIGGLGSRLRSRLGALPRQ